MTTYFYGVIPNSSQEDESGDLILCLSAKEMLASLVYTNTPPGFTYEDVRHILGEDHFDPEEQFDGTRAFEGDDEYYQYPQVVMLGHLPKALSALGEENSGRTDSWLEIPASREQDMLRVAKHHNFTMIRDDELASAINPFATDSARFTNEKFAAAVERLQSQKGER